MSESDRLALVRRVKSIGNAGVFITILAPLPLLAVPDLDERWPLAFGLLAAGGIFMIVSQLLGRLLR
jgi:hypothetical protein